MFRDSPDKLYTLKKNCIDIVSNDYFIMENFNMRIIHIIRNYPFIGIIIKYSYLSVLLFSVSIYVEPFYVLYQICNEDN